MKVSTKGRYGLRLMVDLAVHSIENYVPLKDVAARQDISEKYLEHIISSLTKANLVRSVRGSQGGYQLALPPEEITVGMVLRTIEGSLTPVACVDCNSADCPRNAGCVTIEVWQKLKEAIDNVVDNITLADLVKRFNEKGALPVYYI